MIREDLHRQGWRVMRNVQASASVKRHTALMQRHLLFEIANVFYIQNINVNKVDINYTVIF